MKLNSLETFSFKRLYYKMSNINSVKVVDVDVDNFSLGKRATNKFNGLYVPLLYNGKPNVHLIFKNAMRAPFGIQFNRQMGKDESPDYVAGKDFNNGNFELVLSFPTEYADDEEYQKLRDIDDKIIRLIYEYRDWVGVAKKKAKDLGNLQGEDDRGHLGDFKRLVKWPKTKKEDGDVEYKNYPPTINVKVLADITQHENEEQGLKENFADFRAFGTQFYELQDGTAESIEEVNSNNVDTILPRNSEVIPVIRLNNINTGGYGFACKPVLKQVLVYRKPSGFGGVDHFLGLEALEEKTEQDAGGKAESGGLKCEEGEGEGNEEGEEDGEEFEEVESDNEEEVAPPPAPSRKTIKRGK